MTLCDITKGIIFNNFVLNRNILREHCEDEYLDQKCHLLATLRTATHGFVTE